MTHGFDNTGSLYDKFGNYKNWWSNETKQKFEQKQQCFIEQYNNFTFHSLEKLAEEGLYSGPTSVNGTKTLGENIAGKIKMFKILNIYLYPCGEPCGAGSGWVRLGQAGSGWLRLAQACQ